MKYLIIALTTYILTACPGSAVERYLDGSIPVSDIVQPDMTIVPDLWIPPDLNQQIQPDLSVDSAPPPCHISVCMAGAYTRNSGANPIFDTICDVLPGLVKDCVNGTCYNLFEMFDSDKAYQAVFNALDSNQDGVYDDEDPSCIVSFLGYSWGGVNATEMAQRFVADTNIVESRRILHRLVVIDPYRPLSNVTVPAGVVKFWEYRHSISPSDDCSAGSVLGPYEGIVPECHNSVTCKDYNYSLAPNQVFGGYSGQNIGHCTVVYAAVKPVIHNVIAGQDHSEVPPNEPVNIF